MVGSHNLRGTEKDRQVSDIPAISIDTLHNFVVIDASLNYSVYAIPQLHHVKDSRSYTSREEAVSLWSRQYNATVC